MSDIRVKISVRNARLINAIEARWPSVRKFAISNDLSYQVTINLVAMRIKPFSTSTGEWTKVAMDIATALKMYPDELWPEHMKEIHLRRSTAESTVALADIAGLITTDKTFEQRQIIDRISGTLTPREVTVITSRANGSTLDDLGKELEVSRERIRQIEFRAYHKMKRMAHIKLGIESMDDVT